MSSLVAEPAGPADRFAALSRAARRGRGALLPLLVGAVATGLAWFRLLPGARNTLWAEDAAVFLTQRLHSGPLVSLVLPYDGYQQLVPRLLTDLATAVPVPDYARMVTLLCCLVVGLAAAGAAVWTREALQHPATRVLFALVPVLTPSSPSRSSATPRTSTRSCCSSFRCCCSSDRAAPAAHCCRRSSRSSSR